MFYNGAHMGVGQSGEIPKSEYGAITKDDITQMGDMDVARGEKGAIFHLFWFPIPKKNEIILKFF